MQAQGRGVRSDQSPETRGNGDVEREFDLAKVDGGAGVRNKRENMKRRNRNVGVVGEDERWRENVGG